MIIYRLLRTIAILMAYIPLPAGRFLGRMIGTMLFLFPFERKATAMESIAESLGDGIDGKGANRLLRRVFRHFGEMFFEVPHLMRINLVNLSRHLSFKGERHLTEALGKGKGVFLLTAHLGNWEMMAAALPIAFGKTAAVARPLDFPPLDRLVVDLRSRSGVVVVPKQHSMRRLMAAIKENMIVGILLDQNVAWYEGVFAKFLGRWACTNKGLALMAMKTGTPVIPAFAVRETNGRYRVFIEPEIPLVKTGDKLRDMEDNTALFNAAIEKFIRRYPDQWFWFHRRWKTKNYCPLAGRGEVNRVPKVPKVR